MRALERDIALKVDGSAPCRKLVKIMVLTCSRTWASERLILFESTLRETGRRHARNAGEVSPPPLTSSSGVS